MKTNNTTIVSALRILAKDIKSDDGIANACIEEAANRIEELVNECNNLRIDWVNCLDKLIKCEKRN